MAHLSRKGDWYVARFTYLGKEHKKSLKTRDREDAEAALHNVESRIHALLRGLKQVPANVDTGDYIVWGDAAAVPPPQQTNKRFLALVCCEKPTWRLIRS